VSLPSLIPGNEYDSSDDDSSFESDWEAVDDDHFSVSTLPDLIEPAPEADWCFLSKAEAERRNEVAASVAKALLDSASTCHLTRTRRGIHNVESCNKPVDSANKGRTYMTEMGNWKILADGGTPISLSGTYIMEDFMSDIISLPKLLEKGCKVTHIDRKRIVVSLPTSTETLTFHCEEDGLFYMELKLIESNEQVNEVAEISDDEGRQADRKEEATQKPD